MLRCHLVTYSNIACILMEENRIKKRIIHARDASDRKLNILQSKYVWNK